MTSLPSQLQACLRGRVCFMGLGNPAHRDDGLGVRLAEMLSAAGVPDVVLAGTTPERFVGKVAATSFDHLIFLDAADFWGKPGSVVFLDSTQMAARFPQVSTHTLSLGMLAKWAESNGSTRAWLLGIQPESLKSGTCLTATIQRTVDMLARILGAAAARTYGLPATGTSQLAFT